MRNHSTAMPLTHRELDAIAASCFVSNIFFRMCDSLEHLRQSLRSRSAIADAHAFFHPRAAQGALHQVAEDTRLSGDVLGRLRSS